MKGRDWGRVVFVSSESGVQIPSEMIHYGMTKTAQLAVARGVAETTAGTGVTVNSVLLGPTDSEGVATIVADLAKQRGVDRSVVEAEFFQTARPCSLIRRFAKVEEVANMIVYVCSPLASATIGAALRVNVGLLDDTTGQRAGLLDRLDDSLGRDDRLVLVLQVEVPAEVSSSLHSIQAWRK